MSVAEYTGWSEYGSVYRIVCEYTVWNVSMDVYTGWLGSMDLYTGWPVSVAMYT